MQLNLSYTKFVAYINLDMNAALRGLTLNPRASLEKQSQAANVGLTEPNSQSDGEFRVNRVDAASVLLYSGGKMKPGINRIHRTLERGELTVPLALNHANVVTHRGSALPLWTEGEHAANGLRSEGEVLQQHGHLEMSRKMSSEGEVENPVERQRHMLEDKLADLTMRSDAAAEAKRKSSKSPKKSTHSSSPKKSHDLQTTLTKPSKSTIKITPIRMQLLKVLNIYTIKHNKHEPNKKQIN